MMTAKLFENGICKFLYLIFINSHRISIPFASCLYNYVSATNTDKPKVWKLVAYT